MHPSKFIISELILNFLFFVFSIIFKNNFSRISILTKKLSNLKFIEFDDLKKDFEKDFKIDWPKITKKFISSFNLEYSLISSQIEFKDNLVFLLSNVENLKEEISAILQSETKCEEIVLNLESAGGTVIGYGLAAAQLQRIRDAGIKLTACVDKVAASGGYMMACVANKIVSAPFAIIGSIGVVAAIPNFSKVLKKLERNILNFIIKHMIKKIKNL